MEIKLHTYDIQTLIIALIYAPDDTKVLTPEVKENLENKLCELNKLCCEANDYTLTVNVSA